MENNLDYDERVRRAKQQQANEKRRDTMLDRYGSEEALAAHYREMQQKSVANAKQPHRGGFNDPEVVKRASALGVAARQHKTDRPE